MNQSKLHEIVADLSQLRGSKETKAQYLLKLREIVKYVVQTLSPCSELEEKISQTDKVSMQFILTSLYVLKQLSYVSKGDSLSNLISLQQQQKIKILLQMIFSIGIMPSLFKGVNIVLANKTAQLNLSDLEQMSLEELYIMMSEVIRSLFEILKAPNLRSLVLIHLGDIMAALLQLIHIGEIKKPIKTDSGNENNSSKKQDFVMTEEWYNRLVQDRAEFRKSYNNLVDEIYKPLVIRELLILLAPATLMESGQEVAPPTWLRKAVSQQLSSYLTSSGGVSLIMRAMCDSSSSSSSESVDWKKVDAIAKLISTVHGNLTPEDFYGLIGPQIISLLNTTGPYCIPVAIKCMNNIHRFNPDICNKFILDKLFEPFLVCSQYVTENFNGTLISEDSLSRCIDHISKCFTSGSVESTLSFKALIKIIKIKYKLYMKVAMSPYQHKAAIEDLIIRFLYSYDDLVKLTAIFNALIFNDPHEEMLEMNEDLEFEFAPSGGVQVAKRCKKNENYCVSNSEILLASELAGDTMLDLLSHNEQYSKKLLFYLFIVLLSSMSEWYDAKLDMPEGNQDLLNADELIVFIVGKSQKKMISIKILAVLAENVQVMECIQESPQSVFKFIENLLNKKAEAMLKAASSQNSSTSAASNEWPEGCEDENEDPKESFEDLMLILGVLDVMTMNMKVAAEGWKTCQPLLNSIKVINECCKDNFVKFLSNFLYERIITHGAIAGTKKSFDKYLKGIKHNFETSDLKMNLEEKLRCKSKPARNRELVEEMNEDKNFQHNQKEESKNKTSNPTKSRKNKDFIAAKDNKNQVNCELKTAVEEACSEDIPTRGHGLILISKLLNKRNQETIAKKDYVFTVLKQNLSHPDTYVYLSAINGLEALASVDSDTVIELLSEEFSNKNKCTDLQMKVGEVLVRITRILGDMIPKYKNLLVNTFLRGTKHNDEYMRASSLSNLGEVLQILKYGVGDILQEVYICVQSIVATDKSNLARRAALVLTQLLLKGATMATFVIYEPIITELYKTLIRVHRNDKDEVTRYQAGLALNEVDRLVRSSLNTVMKFEKYIGIPPGP